MRYLAYLLNLNLIITICLNSSLLYSEEVEKTVKEQLESIGLILPKEEKEKDLDTELAEVIKLADDLNYSEAEEKLLTLSEKYPDKAIIYYNLGVISEYSDKGRYSGDLNKAIMFYSRCKELDKNFLPAYFNLGVVYQKLGFFDSAEGEYKKALNIENEWRVHHNLGLIFYSKGDFKKAKEEFLTAFKLNDKSFQTMRCLGLVYEKLGDTASAIKIYKTLYQIETDPVWSSYAKKRLEYLRGY
ncbi:MAG: tetratricopeptide repeat protein [bacterium]